MPTGDLRELAASDPERVPPGFIRRLVQASLGDFEGARAPSEGAAEIGAAGGVPWQQALEVALRPHGLRSRTIFLSAREAVGTSSLRTPTVLRWAGSDGPRWVALLEQAWGRSLAVTSDAADCWLGPEQLARHLGAGSPDDRLPWVLVEPELPSAAAAAGKHGKPPPLRRLLELLRPDRSDLWTVVLYAALIGALTLATPIAVQQLVNTVAFGGLIQPVVILALLLFAVLAFSAVLSALQAYTAELIQRRVFVRVAMDLAERLPRVELGAFDRHHGPELVNRLFDVFTVQKIGALLLLDGTAVLLQTGVGLLILSFYHPLMLAFSILLLGGVSVVVLVFGRGAVATAIGESDAKYAVVSWMEELARSPAAFHSHGGRLFAVEQADRLASSYVSARRRHYRIVLRQLSGALGLQVLASSALLGLGGGLVVAGQLTLGQLVASELIITAIVAAVAKLGKQLESFYDLLAATDKLGVLFDLPLERESGSVQARRRGPASVELRGVSFAYPGAKQALSEVSLRIEAGEGVALTGPTGAGKSTMLDLLAGLRAPSSGFIAVDGYDLRDSSLSDFRSQVALVREQEVFSGTVLDNLRLFRPGLSIAEATDSLARVGLLDDLRSLPDGLRTPLTGFGQPLSRGQVASLVVARAMLSRPRLLLLDEPLASLEDDVRKKVLDALFSPEAPWTLVVVSEQADVLARCSRVIPLGGQEPEAQAVLARTSS